MQVNQVSTVSFVILAANPFDLMALTCCFLIVLLFLLFQRDFGRLAEHARCPQRKKCTMICSASTAKWKVSEFEMIVGQYASFYLIKIVGKFYDDNETELQRRMHTLYDIY